MERLLPLLANKSTHRRSLLTRLAVSAALAGAATLLFFSSASVTVDGDGDGYISRQSDAYLGQRLSLGLPRCKQEGDADYRDAAAEEEERKLRQRKRSRWKSEKANSSSSSSSSSRVFVSLSVCWSSNTRLHHKKDFPYRLATRLAVKLWTEKTRYVPIVQVVYSESDSTPELDHFVSGLESDGAVVRRVPRGDMDCALKSQLVRMIAYRDPAVRSPDDFLVMGDVDAFVVRPDIFAGTLDDDHGSKHEVWLYQYENALKFDSTFSMSFVAMRARTWDSVLGGADSAEALVSDHACALNLHFRSQWDYDQLILSRTVLKSGLCRVPDSSRLWEQVRVDPDTLGDLTESEARNRAFGKELRALEGKGGHRKKKKTEASGRLLEMLVSSHVGQLLTSLKAAGGDDEEFATRVKDDPSSTCFYGFDWRDCNRGRPGVEGGCKWWHFYPNEKERDLMKKYYEIKD